MCASLVSIAACGGNDGDNTDSAAGEVARADSAATAPGAAPGTAATAPAGGAAGGTAGGTMSITGGDPEILQVLAVVDMGEIQDGQLAQRQARNAQVKAFARELVTSHQRSLRQTRQLAKSSNVQLMNDSGSMATGTDTNRSATTPSSAAGTPGTAGATSGVAGQLHTMHMQMMEQVRNQQGAAFDSAFVNAQVRGHQQVLDMLQRAQGQAQNSGVQQHLTAATKEVQTHLERAQQLQQRLSGGGTGGDSATKSGTDTTRKG
jgi:putative membrane protein